MVKKTNEEMMEALNEATKKIGDVYYSLSCQKEKKEPAKTSKKDEPSDPIETILKIALLVLCFSGGFLLVSFGIVFILRGFGIAK